MKRFLIDLHAETTPFPHYWENCVGSCHALTGLREDWRIQLKKCHKELGFRYIRFHGLLNDDMSVCTKEKEGLRYSFYNVDVLFDFILGIGMKPLVELSFMPEALASGTKTVFHYKGNVTPPRDYKEWGTLIEKLTRHLVSRYGIEEVRSWYFEVWNEPNLKSFWSGTQEEYFLLYRYAAEAIKRVDEKIPVGGPATAADAWIPEFREYCGKNHIPLDFISTHHYPTDVTLGHGLDMEERLARSERGILTKNAQKSRMEAGKLPLFYTEWNTSPSCTDPLHDEPYAAAFIIKTLADNQGLVNFYSFWTFSDIFEELSFPSMPFHGGFGLLNLHGVPKPSYRAFELMHNIGTERLPVVSEAESDVEVLAVKGDNKLSIIVHQYNIPRSPAKEENVRIAVKGIKKGARAVLERIDEEHANPKRRWVEMGCPEYPDKSQIDELMESSRMVEERIECGWENDHMVFELKVPPQGIAALTISWQAENV
ncbi:MAG TPA: beta-xylosidase [Clostridiaceae bacterium]|nr:beta-xylosidase [Clostridiaceae bacterium]